MQLILATHRRPSLQAYFIASLSFTEIYKPLAELSKPKLTKFQILPHIYASGPALFSPEVSHWKFWVRSKSKVALRKRRKSSAKHPSLLVWRSMYVCVCVHLCSSNFSSCPRWNNLWWPIIQARHFCKKKMQHINNPWRVQLLPWVANSHPHKREAKTRCVCHWPSWRWSLLKWKGLAFGAWG